MMNPTTSLEDLEMMLIGAKAQYEIRYRVSYKKGYTPGGKKVNPDQIWSVLTIWPGSRDAIEFIFVDEDETCFAVEPGGW